MGSQCYFYVMGIWIEKQFTTVPALTDLNQSDTSIFFFFIWMSSIKATLFISFLFHILLCIFLCYQAFWNLRKLSSHIWLLAETMATLFLFLLNLHVCHLLDCLFFYKINCNWYSVPYIYSALEFLKQFQSFCFQDCVLPLCPIHTHPLWE